MADSEEKVPTNLIHNEALKLIGDEVVRKRIRDALDAPPVTSDLMKVINHPLFTMFVGFVFTILLGAMLTNHYSEKQRTLEIERNERQKKSEQQVRDYEASVQAIEKFSKLVYERQVRASMLASSLKRRASIEELRERKKEYDRVFVEWGVNLKANAFMMRNVLDQQLYTQFESYVDYGLTRIFRSIDQCLTNAYDNRVNKSPALQIRACEAPIPDKDGCYKKDSDPKDCLPTLETFNSALGCGTTITEGLYQYVALQRLVSIESDKDFDQEKQRIDTTIKCYCGL